METKNLIGTHIDTSTLISVIDILGLVNKTLKLPPTFDLLLTLSQFVEAIVIQDKLYFGETYRDQWNPYGELIEKSEIKKIVSKDVLLRYSVTLDSLDMELDAIKWAAKKLNEINLQTLRLAVNARINCYRSIRQTTSIEDKKNPVLESYLQLPKQSGDSKLIESVKHSLEILEFNEIGSLGFHVLVRTLLLLSTISDFELLTYFPHFSRIPLVQSTILHGSKEKNYRLWSINEMRRHRAELIDKYCDPSEYTKLSLKLSPIFLACLINARSPLDIIENALKLRSNKYTIRFRKECRKFEYETKQGINPLLEFRKEFLDSLNNFDDVIKSRTYSKKLIGSISLLGPKVEYSIERSIPFQSKNPIALFLSNIMTSTIRVLNAEELLSNIFGKIPRVDSWLLESYTL